MVADVIAFYEGGVSYTEAVTMPLPELMQLSEQANRIHNARQRAINGSK